MAIDQFLIHFFPSASKPFLTDDGWTVKNFRCSLHRKKSIDIAQKYYPVNDEYQKKYKYEDLFSFEDDIGELTLCFDDNNTDELVGVSFRLSLRHRNLDLVKEKAKEMLQIAKDFNLSVFDAYSGKFVDDPAELIQCILNSRPGRLYFG